ncbi:MAG: hypothetical protein RIQ52_1335 [Pseudomonadota bacterium]|jgi:flagellar FliL protein
MAELDSDLDDITEDQPSGGGIKKLLIVVVVTMLVTLGTAFGALYFLGILPPKEAPAAAHEPAPKVKADLTYLALEPPFVVNFRNNPDIRLAQISVTVGSRKPESLALLTKHMPVVRNNVLLLLGGQDPSVLRTPEGKEALRHKIGEALDKILSEHEHELAAEHAEGGEGEEHHEEEHPAEGEEVDDEASPFEQILFTAFIMQ